MKILITGHLGYIGNIVVKKLQSSGHEVVGFDTGFFQDCQLSSLFVADPKTEIGDVRQFKEEHFPQGIDAVIHLAALSNDALGMLDETLTQDINFKASVHLAEIAKKKGVKRFIFFSSCSVYGIGDDSSLTEKSKINPLTAYAKSKADTEREVSKLADNNFSPVFLRFATAYGYSPRLRFDLVANNLSGIAFTTGKIKIMSDGSPWRPLIHIEDMAEVCLEVLKAPQENIHNQSFNAGQDLDNYQIKTIASIINQQLPHTEVVYTGEHGSDSRTYNVSFEKLKNNLPNLKFKWNLEKGISDLISNYKKINLTYEDFISEKHTRLAHLNHLIKTNKINDKLFWIK